MDAAGYSSGYACQMKMSKKVQRAISKKEKRKTAEERRLAGEIKEAYREMMTTFRHFECATEPELIEYYTYKFKADQIKYGYLIRCMKKIYSAKG